MAGIVATPVWGQWPREYAVLPEPVAKRAKPYAQPYTSYSYDAIPYHKPPHGAAAAAAGRAPVNSGPYAAGAVPVPTPPPSIAVLHNTHSTRDAPAPAPAAAAAADAHAPIRTKSGAGPRASHFCGAVTFLWFSMWPTAKAYLSTRELAPGISADARARPEFMKYARSLIEKADLSPEILTLALLFLYRFREARAQRATSAPVGPYPTSEARVLVVALMTANKLLDDVSYTTATWSKMSGIDLQELKRMETEFLVGLGFNLHVSAKQWAAWEHLVPTILYPAVESLAAC